MHNLLDSSSPFFIWLWQATWQASVVIALVLLAQWLLRKQLTPRWRHALWLLVVIRLALPWSIESRLSLFNWIHPRSPQMFTVSAEGGMPPEMKTAEDLAVANQAPSAVAYGWPIHLSWLWLLGASGLACYLLFTAAKLGRIIRRQRPVTDGAVLSLLEDCKQEMGVRTPLSLVETSAVTSPSLFGFIRPRLLLPAGLIPSFSRSELRYVFLHELSHIKRGDVPVNWLAVAPLILHWFNPLVWFAFNRMRADGELACDALALSRARDAENRGYGQTILKLIESFSRPAAAPGLVGILESNNQMKRRIRMIAKFQKTKAWPLTGAMLFAAIGLVALTDACRTPQKTAQSSSASMEGPPGIVTTVPQVGATDVDPGLGTITVTFDRDMSEGFSWTGGGPDFPAGLEGQKAQWRDKRTCVLLVKLEEGHYYRVGINSTSYQNFRSADGVPANPSAIYFTTRGASEALKGKTAQPAIVAMSPLNQAKDVDAALSELRVTFNVEMGDGFSWCGGGPNFPMIPEGKKPFWTEDHKTCVLPVELKPGREYQLGLNAPSFKNFQSAGGVPLEPITYTFSTKP